MPAMSLSDWLQRLEKLKTITSPQETLEEIRLFIARFKLLSYSPKVIIVGGTNGKGSCVALLESIYLKAGLKVGAFTSPHLIRFNERVRVGGVTVSDDVLSEAFERIEEASDSFSFNYFQYSFLAALIFFKQALPDLIILEVGIGGRSDAVNAVEPDLSIITHVDLDHCDLLGDSRELIALDKAGIMRSGKPVVCGDFDPPLTLQQEAKRLGAEWYCVNDGFFYQQKDHAWRWATKTGHHFDELPLPKIELSNAAVVLMAVRYFMRFFDVSENTIAEGLQQVYLPGRQELIVYNGKRILFDVAHNPGAVKRLVHKIETLIVQGKIYAIAGWQKDKDIKNSLLSIKNYIFNWSLVSLPLPRGAANDFIASVLEALGVFNYSLKLTMQEALLNTLELMQKEDLLVIFGSFMTVSEAYASLKRAH